MASLKGSIFESLDFDHAAQKSGVRLLFVTAHGVIDKKPGFFESKDFISQNQIARLMPPDAKIAPTAHPGEFTATVPIHIPMVPNLTFDMKVEQNPSNITMKADNYNEVFQSSETKIQYSPEGCNQTRIALSGLVVINESAIEKANKIPFVNGEQVIRNQVIEQIQNIVNVIDAE